MPGVKRLITAKCDTLPMRNLLYCDIRSVLSFALVTYLGGRDISLNPKPLNPKP